MKNKIIYLTLYVLALGNIAFAMDDDKVDEAKEALIYSHIEYAKATIDKKCQKLKEKIRKLENRLYKYNSSDDCSGDVDQESLNENRIKIMNQIKKNEDKIDSLRLMRLSLDTINFNAIL